MSKFKLEIETGNAAFDDAPASEIGRILRSTAQRIENGWLPPDGSHSMQLRDSNGNTVGFALIDAR